MIGLDDDGAKRSVVRIGGSSVVHRDREKTSRSKRFTVWKNLLQVPTKRFFPFIDAVDHLKRGTQVGLGDLPILAFFGNESEPHPAFRSGIFARTPSGKSGAFQLP